MSFRNRLILFFLMLVMFPVFALAAVGIITARDAESKRKRDAIAHDRRTAESVYDDGVRRATAAARTISIDTGLARAVRDKDVFAQTTSLERLTLETGVARVRLTLDGREPVEAGGSPGAIAPTRNRVLDGSGKPTGQLEISVMTAQDYAQLVLRATGSHIVVAKGDEVVAKTAGVEKALAADARAVEIGGERFAVASFRAPGFDSPLTISVLTPESKLAASVRESTFALLLLLLAFVVCAVAFAFTAARSLRGQTTRLLDAVRQVGCGDFSVQVPAEGNDEFAALGREFNRMSNQLEGRLEDLQKERTRLQETVLRVGESLGKALDRDAALQIVVQTAVDGVGAQSGRAVMRDLATGEPTESVSAGIVSSYMDVLQAAEAAALEAGRPAEAELDGAYALARPLRAPDASDGLIGVISIARTREPFSVRQREQFEYLTSQASISIEKADLHKAVQRQAVTDELTGLFNHRRFQEVVSVEVERTRRFGHELGLVMLDIDDFKRVNDNYGHLQGDLVLREVARVLRKSSREIDEPARYGGEEMAVALPQTGLEGAYEFAERVRRQIEQLKLPLLEGDGILRVTASFGAAALPQSAEIDKDALVAAADAALYRAKRSGKNRTLKAE